MGYIQQSDTKKIYAYLTQKGKEKFITGDTVDFQVAYFSLHDEDINYKIASQLISPSTYNTLKSGFISDITGDNDVCSPNISESVLLKNNLIYFPPFEGEYLVEGVENFNTEEFEITVSKNGIFQDYTFDITIETISFPNSNSTTPVVIKTETSETYNFNPISVGNNTNIGYRKINLNATCKRIIKDNNGANPIFCLLGDDFLPRKADAFNFIVNVRDSSGTVGFTKRFDNINCSKMLYTVIMLDIDNLPSDIPYPPSAYVSPIDTDVDIKMGCAIIKIDNGNRRSDLNMTQKDIDYFYNSFGIDKPLANRMRLQERFGYPDIKFPSQADNPASFNTFQIPIDLDGRDLEAKYIYGNTQDNGFLYKQTIPTFIRTPLYSGSSWFDYAPNVITDTNFSNNFPPGYILPNPLTPNLSDNFSIFHPTVELFEDWKNGSTGFQMRFVEVSSYIKPPSIGAGEVFYGANYGISRFLSHETNNTYNQTLTVCALPEPNSKYNYQLASDGTNQSYIYGIISLNFIGVEFTFGYCWGNPIMGPFPQCGSLTSSAAIIMG